MNDPDGLATSNNPRPHCVSISSPITKANDTMRISLIIPAWNEERFLPRLLESVGVARDQFRGGADEVEVIVANNNSTDRTADIAKEAGYLVADVTKRCIAAARNGGAGRASGELLAFADADFRIAPTTFNYIDKIMQQPGVIGGGTGLTMERWSWGIRATLYSFLVPLWMLGVDGGVWFCRRADFEEVGGYDETVKAAEDVLFLRSLQRLGKSRSPKERLVTRFAARRFGLQPAIVTNSARKFDKHGEWHMFRDAMVTLPRLIFRPQAKDEYIRRYWYEDRLGDDQQT